MMYTYVMKRTYAKDIHPLADETKPCGSIKFIHTDNKEHIFAFATNTLSGSRLSWFDNSAPSVDDTTKWVKSVFKDIKAECKVIECIGDYA